MYLDPRLTYNNAHRYFFSSVTWKVLLIFLKHTKSNMDNNILNNNIIAIIPNCIKLICFSKQEFVKDYQQWCSNEKIMEGTQVNLVFQTQFSCNFSYSLAIRNICLRVFLAFSRISKYEWKTPTCMCFMHVWFVFRACFSNVS